MSRPAPDPACPLCRGLGWYESPYYGDFEPKIVPLACPNCNPVEPIPTSVKVIAGLAALALVGALAALAWGLP